MEKIARGRGRPARGGRKARPLWVTNSETERRIFARELTVRERRDALLAAVEAKHAIHPALSVSAPVSDGDVGGLVERIFDSVVSSPGLDPCTRSWTARLPDGSWRTVFGDSRTTEPMGALEFRANVNPSIADGGTIAWRLALLSRSDAVVREMDGVDLLQTVNSVDTGVGRLARLVLTSGVCSDLRRRNEGATQTD